MSSQSLTGWLYDITVNTSTTAGSGCDYRMRLVTELAVM